MRPDIGTIWADDGWRLEWDLSVMTQRIDVYKPDGDYEEIRQYRISGEISPRHLDREIRNFLCDHPRTRW